ncbi:MAG TPA: ClpXP protease specificity-enhancing factor [Burkholderiaceae bacterium]|nr:ClpXP protease specificity-enhancing factor [Burkholderiaceae bacterium]
MTQPNPPVSTKPYLIRALYEWCAENGYTPFIVVSVDDSVQVPREFVQNAEIVLNISLEATSGLKLANDYVSFQARFGGVAREIVVPVGRVSAIYARENGEGMAFPVEASVSKVSAERPQRPPAGAAAGLYMASADGAPAPGGRREKAGSNKPASETPVPPPKPPSGARPTLTRIK